MSAELLTCCFCGIQKPSYSHAYTYLRKLRTSISTHLRDSQPDISLNLRTYMSTRLHIYETYESICPCVYISTKSTNLHAHTPINLRTHEPIHPRILQTFKSMHSRIHEIYKSQTPKLTNLQSYKATYLFTYTPTSLSNLRTIKHPSSRYQLRLELELRGYTYDYWIWMNLGVSIPLTFRPELQKKARSLNKLQFMHWERVAIAHKLYLPSFTSCIL